MRNTGTKKRYLASAGLLLLASVATAEPLYDQSFGAIPGVFHFPDSTDSANLAANGRLLWSLAAITSSHSIETTAGDESLSLDGETSRTELRFRYGLSDKIEIGLELPYLWHESGMLDSFITSWHNTIGIHNSDRSAQQENELRIAYTDLTASRLDFNESANGVGDLRLTAGWQLHESPTHRTALRLGVSLPTGDSAQLLGSGAATLSLGFAGDLKALGGYEWLNGYYRVHAIYVGEPDLLADRYRDLVGQLSAGLGLVVTRSIELRLQVATRCALYDSEIETLGEPSVALALGANFKISDNYLLSLGFAEDVKIQSAPDISFQLALRYRPRN